MAPMASFPPAGSLSGDPALSTRGTVDPAEVEKFAAIAEEWWSTAGKFAPLHKLNPARVSFVRERAAQHFGRDGRAMRPLEGLTLLDVGCGGGLIAEPMARLGAIVTGIDATQRNIEVAALHAQKMGLPIVYRASTAEEEVAAGMQADIVLALEIVEHVADLPAFMTALAALVRPGGLVVLSTMNRTLKAIALAKYAAEYILRWLPPGTHDWRRFQKPSELAAMLRAEGLLVGEVAGLVYDPFFDRFSIRPDASVNYLMLATRPL